MKNYFFLTLSLGLLFLAACTQPGKKFESKWNSVTDRVWTGPDYWANPLQDWKISKGMLECLVTGPNRSVHLLTYALGDTPGNLETSVNLHITPEAIVKQGWAGFIIGAKGKFNDYRDDAVYGQGLHAGITTDGVLFIGEPGDSASETDPKLTANLAEMAGIVLKVSMITSEPNGVEISLSATLSGEKSPVEIIRKQLPSLQPKGNIALKADFTGRMNNPERSPSAKFSEWKVSGSAVTHYPEREWGPVLFTQYTNSKDVVKLTAQMPPLSKDDPKQATLEIKKSNGNWEPVATSAIDPMSFTAVFRFEHISQESDLPYRVAYQWGENPKAPVNTYYEGTIRKDPIDKEEIVVAAFTGNHDFGFPNQEVTENVLKHAPDLLAFTGDQIYEPRGGFGNIIDPVELATLDYLRKWFMVGWEYGEMLKNIPSVSLPDDHDVYHGNVWGSGGKAAKRSDDVKEWQDDGGYKLPSEWVNMVQRTQTAHMPDPFDPTPVLQNISVYYCDLNVGGISFAIIEDRKWKTAPKSVLPEYLKVSNGWAENSRFNDPGVFDVEADLLGDRQIHFLNEWAGDWSHKTIMKSVISQTIFSTVATLPDSAVSDVVVPRLRITNPGEYPENDIPTQDMDGNGWPRKGRDLALRTMRKGYAFHIAGDQHLATTIQYGIDDWGDAGYAICVPSVSNFFPRRWFPSVEGKNRQPGQDKNLGDFTDGFGNKITLLAVANPVVTGLEPSLLYDRSTGYGIIRFNKKSRDIQIENWPRKSDPTQGGKPYPGWPITINQMDNFSKPAAAWLPRLVFSGAGIPPVVRVISEKTGEMQYAIRTATMEFDPKVFSGGTYTIEAGEPGTPVWRVLNGIVATGEKGQNTIKIDL